MEYWYLWLIFIVLCAVTAFVLKKASAALQQHNSDTKQMYDEIERLKTLKDKYKNADAQQIAEAPAEELLAGMCAVLQAKIERAENANACFCAFSAPQGAKRCYSIGAKNRVYSAILFGGLRRAFIRLFQNQRRAADRCAPVGACGNRRRCAFRPVCRTVCDVR